MSVEDAVTEGLEAPMDRNAQAAEEAKRMLAELEEETHGAEMADAAVEDVSKESEPAREEGIAAEQGGHGDAEDEERERRQDRGRREHGDRNRGRGRGDRNGYGGRGRDRHDREGYKPRSHRDNIKFDPTTKEISDDPAEIRKQVHFYFSDSNLPKDKFLFGLTGGLENKPVPLTKIHSFKRMQRFQPFEAIVDALKASDQVELTDNDTAVRRKNPLPTDYFKAFRHESDARTVYVKGFGDETASTQFDIEAFFDPYGPTRAVRLRRNDEKVFKGSVFVEFENEELAKAFLALDPQPKYKDRELQIMSKIQYTDKKEDDLKTGRIVSNQDERRGGKRGNRDRRGSWDHGKRHRDRDDDRDWRERRDEDQKRGFRDDKRRGDRDRGNRGGRPGWVGGGRSRGPDMDDRGIPTIKSTAQDKDTGRDEALAKAKAAVEADVRKEQDEQNAADNVESMNRNGAADAVADSAQADIEATAGKKRAREDDDGEAGAARETKKVDTKTEAEPVTVDS